MGNCKYLDHAIHNEKACYHLNRKGEFLDWVITVAFYSSIHFVRHKIFPVCKIINGKNVTFNDFESFYRQTKKIGSGRHGFTVNYLDEHHEDIASPFHKLYDLSTQARYINYIFDRETSAQAVKQLKKIKEYCVVAETVSVTK